MAVGVPMLRSVRKSLLGRRAPGLACLAGGRAGGAADAPAGETRRGRPDRHRGADEGSSCLQGGPSEAGDGGRTRGSRDASGSQGSDPSRGHGDGGGVTNPGGLRSGCSSERL
jgi:hypothetical protein